ncbi:MAG: sigma-70 family RNA polymerase sigma factor [Clostridia bacterium]
MEYANLSDENLAELAKSDNSAVEILIGRYKGVVISLSRKYFLQGGELDDLISEGSLGLYKAILFYDAKKNATFSTFAYICISRQLISAIKLSLSTKHIALNQSLPLYDHEEMSGGVDPEELFLFKEQEARLFGMLRENLSAFEFDVLSDYLNGLSYIEISKKYRVDAKKVDNALTRAKKKVGSILRR